MLTPVEKEKIKKDLQQCNDMQQVFNYINANWDLTTAKLGPLSKPKVIDGFITTINLLNPKRK